MKKHLIILFLGFAVPKLFFGQLPKAALQLMQADSIIILSHLNTTDTIPNIKLVDEGKPNYYIINKMRKLVKYEINSLVSILTAPNYDKTIEDIQCFEPHHGILIFKNGACSFFDICFGCRHFVTSDDITLSDEISRNSWTILERFFRNKGLSYELPKNN